MRIGNPLRSPVASRANERCEYCDWTVHFLLHRETGEIEGQTSIGRTTVEILLMNAEQPIRARRNLIKLEVL